MFGRAQLAVEGSHGVCGHAGEGRQPQGRGEPQVGRAAHVGREGSDGAQVLRHLGHAGHRLRGGHRHGHGGRGGGGGGGGGWGPAAEAVVGVGGRRGHHHGLGLDLATHAVHAVVEVVQRRPLHLEVLLGPTHQVQGRVVGLAAVPSHDVSAYADGGREGRERGRKEARGGPWRPDGGVRGGGQQGAGLATHSGRQRVARVVGGGGQLWRGRGHLRCLQLGAGGGGGGGGGVEGARGRGGTGGVLG